MGEVYRAHDTTLRRDIALKVLSPALARDAEHVKRFSREARLLATLNHPRIATIHGFEHADGVHALAMELVDGPTLAERLLEARRGGGLPLPDVLHLGLQIAEAVEAAHEKGVIHRDLKPANIKLDHDGNVKVLDFGVAKVFSSGTTDSGPVPTITGTAFQSGRIIGTPAYMSPEQARGHAVDKRTDIWAFGCVLYEMLTGRLVFTGHTSTDTIAAILGRQPDWTAVPAHTPPAIRHLLRRCLEKDPNGRLHDIADARIEIEDLRSGTHEVPLEASARPILRRWVAWASAAALTLLAAAGAAVWGRPDAPAAPEARLDIITPPSRDPSLALSPDGMSIVFVGRSAGGSQLWLRRLDSATARPLAGTERATRPFWSPDGRSIGFFADTSLRRMDVDGGSMRTVASQAGVALGGTWNRDGTILYASNPGGPIVRTSAEGAPGTTATRLGPGAAREARETAGPPAPRAAPEGCAARRVRHASQPVLARARGWRAPAPAVRPPPTTSMADAAPDLGRASVTPDPTDRRARRGATRQAAADPSFSTATRYGPTARSSKGRRPESISYRTTPSAYTSVAGDALPPRTSPGARYPNVPSRSW
jgi:serine/threonine protein kinase